MPRYLTPSKIALLALVSIYAEGSVPESVTVKVLWLLLNHVIQTPARNFAAMPTGNAHAIPIETFEKELSPLVSSFPGRSMWDLLLKRIWSIDCADALHTFLTNIPTLLFKTKAEREEDRKNGIAPDPPLSKHLSRIARTSPIGVLIRRSHIEFIRLQFHDSISLWENFVAYRLPTRHAWARRNPSEGRSSLDSNLSYLALDASSSLTQVVYRNIIDEEASHGGFSAYDTERLLEFQVSEIQRHGSRLPEELGRRIQDMVRTGLPVPNLIHYLSFLDSWRSGDYSSAFDNLHRYFDYTLLARERTFYQYALLNLAILQADFGCHSEVIPAMKEAVSTARENKDMACLNFCMSWLYHFGKAYPSEMKEIQKSGMLGSELEGLSFLKAKAKESEMWNLLSTSLISEAKLGLQMGESIAVAFENLTKASHLNVTKIIFNVMGPQLILRSSLFGRIGCTHLAKVYGDMYLECFTEESPADDTLKSRCRMANLLVQCGRSEKALSMLESISPNVLRVLKYQQYWAFFVGLVKLRRLLHLGDLTAASYLHSQLKAQGPPDLEVAFTLSLLHIDLFARQRNYRAALSTLEDLAKPRMSDSHTDILAQVKLLNLKARLLDQCNQTLKSFSIAVRACTMAYNSRLLPALWESVGILSNILSTLSEFEAAAQLLGAIAPQVHECQDCELLARTYSVLVDAHMGMAGQAEPNSATRLDHFHTALNLIDTALEAWAKVEDTAGQCDMLVKKATVLRLLGDVEPSNVAAARYLEVRRKAEEGFLDRELDA